MVRTHTCFVIALLLTTLIPAAAYAASEVNSPDEAHGQSPGQVAATVTPPKSPALGVAPGKSATTSTLNLAVHIPTLHLGSVRMGPYIPDNLAIGIKFALDL